MLTAEQLEQRKQTLGCDCLARRLLELAQEGKHGRVDFGHMARPAFDRLVEMVPGALTFTVGATTARRYLTLWAERDGIRIYAQADAEVRDADD